MKRLECVILFCFCLQAVAVNPVVLDPHSKTESLYAWRKAECSYESKELRIVVGDKRPRRGRGTLVVNFENFRIEKEKAFFDKANLRFQDRAYKGWVSDFTDGTNCEWEFSELSLKDEKPSLRLSFECTHLHSEEDFFHRAIGLFPSNSIVCGQEEPKQ